VSCDVRLYDGTYGPLPAAASVQLVPINTSMAGRPNLCTAVTYAGGGSVHLSFVVRHCVYQVAIVDPSRTYGGIVIPSLNGNVSGQLEVVLNLSRDIFPAAGCVLLICFLSTTNTPQLAAGIFY
jgi:hypothetical protein